MLQNLGLYAVKKVRQNAEKVAHTVKQTGKDAVNDAKQTVDKTSISDQDKQQGSSEKTVEKATDKVKEKSTRTLREIQDKTTKATKKVAGDVAKEATGFNAVKKAAEMTAPCTTFVIEKTHKRLKKTEKQMKQMAKEQGKQAQER